ncbi:hypothetical protein M6K074_2373 [Staphylococcus aureus]|nr:hypothetical protein M6K074_2303 [Staphylococcus aureus]GBY65980.1 hypothetical protein M6K074_2373 [Staphylococcus aureus]
MGFICNSSSRMYTDKGLSDFVYKTFQSPIEGFKVHSMFKMA